MVLAHSTAPVPGPVPPTKAGSYDSPPEVSRATHQAASLVDFDGKPLIIVTAGRQHDATWPVAQDKLATLSTNSRHDVVADATHPSLVLDETDAAAASKAIRDVVTSVRTSKPLASSRCG